MDPPLRMLQEGWLVTVVGTVSDPELERWVAGRRTYLDNVKVVLIAAIIVIHALLGYASFVEPWTYTEYRETTLATATQVVLFVLAAPFGMFLIALLFLVAGLLSPPSVERKGTRRFVVDRLLRLGVPFALYVFAVQPLLTYGLQRVLDVPVGSFWQEYGAEGRVDTGPLWFVGVLLVYSLAFAAWHAWRSRRPTSGHRSRREVSPGLLALVAAVVAPASFLVRLAYPYGSESGPSDLNLWEWPACVAVFALGVAGAHRGWLSRVPADLERRCRSVTLVAVVATAALLALVASRDALEDALGGPGWAAAGFATADAVLTVFGAVWLLGVAQRRLDRRYRWGPPLARSAYGAFILQTLVLLALAVALRPLGLAAEAKALVVAVGGVVCSFGAAALLIRHVPGVARVL